MQDIPQKNTNTPKQMDKPKSQKRMLLVAGIILVFALIVFGIVWFFISTRRDAADDAQHTNNSTANLQNTTANTSNTTNSANNTQSNSATNSAVRTVPTSASQATINNTVVYYPTSWGEAKVTATKENINSESPYESVFEGGNATFKNNSNALLWINSTQSYLSDNKEFLSNDKYVVDALKLAYSEQAITNVTVNDLNINGRSLVNDKSSTQYVLPLSNSTQIPYSPHYVYAGSDWRGYWYIADETQDPSAFSSPMFVATMYNKDKDVIYSLKYHIETTASKALKAKVNADVTKPSEADIDAYMKNAYTTDSELKAKVDEILELVELTGYTK